MKLTVLVPGLLWPNSGAQALTEGLHLPALTALLSAGRHAWQGGERYERALTRAFGIDPDSPPTAALRRYGERDHPDLAGTWLCADPVHLHIERDRMLLTDGRSIKITSGEASALIRTLNEALPELDPTFHRFEARAAHRWYLSLRGLPELRLHPLDDAVGRPVDTLLPTGPDATRWRRILNEIQVLLHEHPVNRAREASGLPTINSLWLWGGGQLPVQAFEVAPVVRTNDRVAIGLARLAGARSEAPSRRPMREDTFVADISLLHPALHLDIETWRHRLLKLEETLFGPLLHSLRRDRGAHIQLDAPSDRASLSVGVSGWDLLKFWRKPLPLDPILTGSR